MQTTDTVFMVRPSLFKVNEETALSNYFQKPIMFQTISSSGRLPHSIAMWMN